MLFTVFAHIQTNQRILIVKHEFCQRLCQFGFSHSGRPDEDKGTDRALWIFQPRAGTADRIRNSMDRLILSDDALVKIFFHVQQPLGFILQHLAHRDPGPLADDLGHIIHIHHFIQLLGSLPFAFPLFIGFLRTQTFGLQFCRFFIIAVIAGIFLLFHHTVQVCFHLFQVRRK